MEKYREVPLIQGVLGMDKGINHFPFFLISLVW